MAMGHAAGTAAAALSAGPNPAGSYQRHRPEQTLLYQIIAQHYPTFRDLMEAQDRELPFYVQREFDDFLKCGRLEHGFLRVRCDDCHAEHLVAFSCKRRGFCPSCGARRMTESAALLVHDVLPRQPVRQWVLSFPFQLRYLFANRPAVMGQVLGIVYRVIATHLIKKAGFNHQNARTGAVTLIQRFGSTLNLNLHFHMLFLDGVYVDDPHKGLRFVRVKAPSHEELTALVGSIAQRVCRKLERLCRYISRPAVAEQRLSLTSSGQIRNRLKTPYLDGTTHVIFEPLDFIARLAALALPAAFETAC